jgi:eukaryotic-like serine/threonine-protein kinase
MSLSLGTKLGPYEIVAPLGAGGMGEVYRARDTRLNRTVAIKILPANISTDPVAKQRFEREAKTISRLNHPNICALYDVGSQDGVDYLVMECLEGETLAKRLENGALPLCEVLKIGREMAEALDKAHRNGMVHRDLKPGNIMLTKAGAKLLDFGLAKSAAPMAAVETMTVALRQSPVTQEGTIVGTIQYMSPEQVEGKELDGRSDIFSLGAVLYEMLTGQRAFEGKSQLSVASAILEKEPAPISTAKPMTPPALDHAIRRCLAKDPDERWQTARDFSHELKWADENSGHLSTPVPPARLRKAREALAWLISIALLAILIAGTLWWRSSQLPDQTMYFRATLPFPARDIAIAPNGHTMALVAQSKTAGKNVIWIYELGSQRTDSLPGTEGATYPFWSPDGRFLAFFADGKLKKLELSGGPVHTLCDAPSGRGGTWNKDGVIVFAPVAQGGLYRISASGGTPGRISNPDPNKGEGSRRWPVFLPDGTHYLYLAANFSGRKGVDGIFVGSLDSNEKRFVVEATANAAYAEPGFVLFYRDNTLFAQRFDWKGVALSGEATAILTDIQAVPQVRRAVFGVSQNGLLVAQTGSQVALSQPMWFDRKGKELGILGKPDVYGNVSVAPNGRLAAVSKTDVGSQNTDIWTYDLQRDSVKRLTFDPAIHIGPVWSPDATELVFSSSRQLGFDLYTKKSDGTQDEKVIVHDDVDKVPNDWSRDGKYILYAGGTDLWLVNVPELQNRIFLKAPSVLKNGQFSPDGKWVAYASNESGRWEIYVTSFPEARGKWQVSVGGGEEPRWRGDGKELFYISSGSKMMATPLTIGANFDAGAPVELFQTIPRPLVTNKDLFVYGVSRDGQRFLVNTQAKEAETESMTVILDWTAKLNK